MMIKKWLASGALLTLAALSATGVLPPKDGDPGLTTGGAIVANDLPPDNMQAKH
jgi:hypothetical protein